MPWLLALLFLLSFSAGAQTPKKRPAARKPAPAAAPKPSASERFPLEIFEVTGNQNFKREQILAAAGLKVGQSVADADFEGARQRLLKAGVFQSVGYRSRPSESGKGYAVTYEVVEFTQVYPWRVEELPKTAAEIGAELARRDPLFGERIPATREVLERYAGILSQITNQKVAGRLSPDPNGELYVLFRPDKPRATVAEIQFRGTKILSSMQLQNAIAPAAVGTLFTEELFRTLLERNIRPMYDARGYMRVAFPKITAAPALEVQGVAVTVQVEEGLPYQFGKVTVQGGGELDAELTKAAAVRSGDVANFDQVKAGQEKALSILRRRGYMNATAQNERKLDDSKKVLDVVVRVTPGVQFRFGTLTIEGLDILTEPGVRKLWALKAGAPYNAEYPEKFLDRIREDGVLDDLGETKFRTQVHEDTRTVDVVLTLKGAPAAPDRRRRRPSDPAGTGGA